MPEKILIVDDDIDTLKLVGLILQRQGYEVSVASSGVQALAMMKSETPDLLLLDIMMPEMDGYEVAERMRAEPELAEGLRPWSCQRISRPRRPLLFQIFKVQGLITNFLSVIFNHANA